MDLEERQGFYALLSIALPANGLAVAIITDSYYVATLGVAMIFTGIAIYLKHFYKKW